jgi:hypothetical protein
MESKELKQIINESIVAAKDVLGKSWKKFKPYAEHEFRQFAENTEFLTQLKLAGTLSHEELKARLEIQRLALNNVLLTIDGIGLITAQNTINAVLKVIYKAIETLFDITLPA